MVESTTRGSEAAVHDRLQWFISDLRQHFDDETVASKLAVLTLEYASTCDVLRCCTNNALGAV